MTKIEQPRVEIIAAEEGGFGARIFENVDPKDPSNPLSLLPTTTKI